MASNMAGKLGSRVPAAVFISGTGTNMAALLYASRQPGSAFEIVLVASNVEDAGGLEFARLEGIPTFVHSHKGCTRDQQDAAMEMAALNAGAEAIVLAGYMRILTPEFTRRWQGRILNIHPSLLPKYKGLDTHARAIEAGDSHAGASVHVVTPELDAGEVIAQAKVAIAPGDTAETLARRVQLAEHQLYPCAVNDYLSRGNDPDHLLGQVRALALALPETSERESHGSPGFRVGGDKSGKFFAYFADRHHGSDHIALLVKTSGMDEMMNLIENQPGTYFKPAFYGASGWVGIVLNSSSSPGAPDWTHVEQWLSRSWRAVAPKRITKLLDAADMF